MNPLPSIIPIDRKILLIPDLHQNIAWAEQVIDAEPDAAHVIFMGDYFDPRNKQAASASKTCEWINQRLHPHENHRYTFLLGNHDIPYLEAYRRYWQHRHQLPKDAIETLRYRCGDTSRSQFLNILEHLDPAFWKNPQLFCLAFPYLISHAGLASPYWDPDLPLGTNLIALQRQIDSALNQLHQPHPILLPGKCRGGTSEYGGITWLDFDDEFETWAAAGIPQIVGHTSGLNPRNTGNSWCIDCGQSTYAVIEADGTLRIER
jgi:hypothetical protein